MDNLTRLTFETHTACLDWFATNRTMFNQVWTWHETVGDRPHVCDFAGVCDLCSCQTTYSITPEPTQASESRRYRANWAGGLRCGCGVHSIDRAIWRLILDEGTPSGVTYHVGHFSGLANFIRRMAAEVVTSQFDDRRQPGEVVDGVRYEDLTRLTFDDGSFDNLIASEILEHIPDYTAALREMHRVLRPGGVMVQTFPWLGGEHYDHLIRAELRPDGSVRHILEPEYHGDPLKTEGILSFRSFGWKILDEIRTAGFKRAYARVIFSPFHGQMTLLHPVIVGIK